MARGTDGAGSQPIEDGPGGLEWDDGGLTGADGHGETEWLTPVGDQSH